MIHLSHHPPRPMKSPFNPETVSSRDTTPIERDQRELYTEAALIAQDIMTIFPPEQYTYVGIGRSPSVAIMSVLERLTESSGHTVQLPVSGFRYRSSLTTSQTGKALDNYPVLTAPEKAAFHRHCDRFLQNISPSRSLLLIDHTTSGISCISTQEHLQEYVDARFGPGVAVHMLAFMNASREAIIEDAARQVSDYGKVGNSVSQVVGALPAPGRSVIRALPNPLGNYIASFHPDRKAQWLRRWHPYKLASRSDGYDAGLGMALRAQALDTLARYPKKEPVTATLRSVNKPEQPAHEAYTMLQQDIYRELNETVF